MSVMRNKEIVRSYAEEVFSRGNLDLVGRLVSPDFVNHDAAPGQGPGPAGEKQRAMMFCRGFRDLQVTVEDMVAEGDRVSARIMTRGAQRGQFLGIPPAGKQVSWQTFVLYRIANVRLGERWGTHDYLAPLHQLGATCELQAMPAG